MAPRWTLAEEIDLVKLCDTYGTASAVDWDAVARILGKSVSACKHKYVRKAEPRKERMWTADEIEKLKRMTHGYLKIKCENWFYIGLALGRSPVACRLRYQHTIRDKNWTHVETHRLKHAMTVRMQVVKTQKHWRAVAKYVATRNTTECKKKWAELHG
jgi:hypothetical protein